MPEASCASRLQLVNDQTRDQSWNQDDAAKAEGNAAALYSKRAGLYARLIRLIGYQKGLEQSLATEMSSSLKPNARVLDAGCGAGALTFALLSAFARLRIPRGEIDGFDLTPAMLQLFGHELSRHGVEGVRLHQADVLNLEGSLPPDWRNYDLVVSSAMLEYLPRSRLAEALGALRAHLVPDGRLLFFISREGAFNRWAIKRWWQANCYSRSEIEAALSAAGFSRIIFHRFRAPYAYLNSWGHAVEARLT